MTGNAILRQKLEQSRIQVSSYPKLAVVAAAHAREAAARTRSLFNTEADVKTEATAIMRAGRYLRGLPSPAVLGVLEIDGMPNSAAFHMDAKLVSHVVDLSMGGDPASDNAFPDRVATMIDLAFCRRFADAILEAFDVSVRTVCGGKSIGTMRCTRFETQPQMASIAPERSEVMVVNQRVEIGESTRNGFFELVLPLSAVDPIKGDLMQRFGSPSRLNSDLWDQHLRRSLMQSRLELDAVIDTQFVPLSKLATLRVGDVLKLGKNARDEIELVMHAERGAQVVAGCRLGAKGTQKAVKLLHQPSTDLVDQLSLDL